MQNRINGLILKGLMTRPEKYYADNEFLERENIRLVDWPAISPELSTKSTYKHTG